MKNIAIVYWSGTGNTENLALTIQKNLIDHALNADVYPVNEITAEVALNADALILGCPSMGAEVLEESEMEPFIEAIEKSSGIKDKPLALFGSYDWGDGQWMRDWHDRMQQCGANMISQGLIFRLEPDKDAIQAAEDMAKAIANHFV